MAVELTVPALGESITEAVVGKWHKKVGDAVQADEAVVVLETDKVTIDVAAPAAGALSAIAHVEGDKVKIGDVLGTITAGAAGAVARTANPTPPPALPAPARAPAPAPLPPRPRRRPRSARIPARTHSRAQRARCSSPGIMPGR